LWAKGTVAFQCQYVAVSQKGGFHFSARQKLELKQFFINFSQPAWSIWKDGSIESDLLSHML
jgi:hypothetical protein